MTEPLNELTNPADTPRILTEMFRELEAVLRTEVHQDIDQLVFWTNENAARVVELERRTEELADKLAKVVLALMEADAAILERVAALEALLTRGTIIEANPERKKRRWPFGRD